MKTKLLPFLFVLCLLAACKDEPDPILKVSESTLKADELSADFKINITSDSEWTAECAQSWCVLSATSGSQNEQLTLTLDPNTGTTTRNATVLLKAGKTSQSIDIEQAGSADYSLPVVFHVLHSDASDLNQNVPAAQLAKILAACNKHYKAKANPVTPDMNLQFTLATTDPLGTTLAEAGVDRVLVANSTIDCEAFMNRELPDNNFYVSKVWDPNKYINVFVYTFTVDNILGISHLPYATSASPLEGLHTSDYYSSGQKPSYPHCVSLNTTHIYRYDETGTWYYTDDVVNTLSHELGHYLGLYHTFTEVDIKDGNGNVIDTELNTCQDTDYCEDTPTYNSVEYYDLISKLVSPTLFDLTQKKNCEGVTFTARNIMDYAYCYSDQFTNDQRNRIRHVLLTSPLIPGPKSTRAVTSRSPQDLVEPPIIFKK